MELIDESGSFWLFLDFEESAAGGLHLGMLAPGQESSECHHFLDAVGIEMIAELLEMRIFYEVEAFLAIEKEGDHQDLIVFFIEEVALDCSFSLLLQDTLLLVVVSYDEPLQLKDSFLIACVILAV